MLINTIYFLTYITVSAFGLYLLKAASQWQTIQFGIGFLFYAAGFLLWLYLLRRLPLSAIFPIAAGGLIIATQLIGYFALNEKISAVHLLGTGLIFSGICLVYSHTQ